jgi:hypothetical protein|tara:strand:- start:11428 stop:12027 length:600 start_codon:yes stop_codon:yes gene_type:complete
MATTSIDICARALVMIGAQPISSFSDGSTEALVASNIYDDVCEASLTRHRWRFATTQKTLSLLADSPTGRYDYGYQMPTDPAVLQIISITVNDYVIPYSRYKDYIYVNSYGSSSSLVMDYIYKVGEGYFPPHFKLALEYELAAVFAGSVARDSAMIRQFKELAERQFLVAKNIDSQETTTKVLDTNRFVNLRNSTRTDV